MKQKQQGKELLLKEFPKSKIKPQKATLSGIASQASLEMLLEPFTLELDGYSEQILAPIILEGISLPSVELSQLRGRTFHFPKNPEEGYIDGSFYFFSAHHPIDVTKLEFSQMKDGQLFVTIS
ncbi:MAG: hypothetical protein AAF614_34765, partial [Chloroflexota bacterium]